MEQKPIYAGIVLNSDYHKVNNNIAELELDFKQPLEISKKGHYIKLMLAKIPLTFENIKASLTNTTLRYSINDGVGYSVITIPAGLYEFSQIWEEIAYQIQKNGHLEYDSFNNPIYPFRIGVNEATGKGQVVIDNTHSTYPNIIVDLSNNTTSLFYLLYGFTSGTVICDADVSDDFFSTNNADLYDSFFKIKMNHIESFTDAGFEKGNTLHQDFFTGVANDYMTISSREDICCKIDEGLIQNFKLSIVDRNDNHIVFNDTSVNSNTFFRFNIY